MPPAKSKFPDWAWKVMALLVIPAFGWVIKLEANKAVQTDQIATLQKTAEKNVGGNTARTTRITALEGVVKVQDERLKTLQADLKEAKGMRDAINANTIELAKLGTKIDAIVTNLEDVKTILRQP